MGAIFVSDDVRPRRDARHPYDAPRLRGVRGPLRDAFHDHNTHPDIHHDIRRVRWSIQLQSEAK